VNWIEVRATFSPPPADWSPAVEAFREAGIENTLEDGEVLSGAIVDVPGAAQAIAILRTRLRELGASAVIDQALEEVDWDQAWRQHFKPRRIGERFVIRPTWEPYEAAPGDLVIDLDPGQAFGTGEHPTTQSVLALMERVDFADRRVLDLGTGSGVLAIAAMLLGARSAVGTDVEAVAVEVARENARSNGFEIDFRAGEGFDPVPEPEFDVVLSNIISAVLIRLAPEVAPRVAAGGLWITSGVIAENWADVRQAAEAAGFGLEDYIEADGWVSARFVKR
jgi:ribosomal protein L11 methyltransferase